MQSSSLDRQQWNEKKLYLMHVHVYDVTSDIIVCDLVTIVEDDEKQVETRHNGCCDVNVGLERLAAVCKRRICVRVPVKDF